MGQPRAAFSAKKDDDGFPSSTGPKAHACSEARPSPHTAEKPAEKRASIAQPTPAELRQTPTARIPQAVGSSAMGAADRKVRGALARLSSELSSATTRDDASSAITRAKNALRAVENVPVHAVLDQFTAPVPLLGFKNCPSFLQLNKDAWAGERDGHLNPSYGELSASARSLQDLHKRTQEIVVDDAVKDAVARASDFASGFLDGSNPLPSPAMGAVFHHDAAYTHRSWRSTLAQRTTKPARSISSAPAAESLRKRPRFPHARKIRTLCPKASHTRLKTIGPQTESKTHSVSTKS